MLHIYEPKKEEPIVPKENIEAKVVQEIKVDNNDNSYVEKMLAGGDNFKAIKSKIKEIIFDKNNEKAFGRIMDAFEPMISQVNEESTIQTTANKIIATLKEIKEAKEENIKFLFQTNYLLAPDFSIISFSIFAGTCS